MTRSPADALRLVVRQWDDAQLRRAWLLSTHTLEDPTRTASAAEARAVLLEEWERRHPREPGDWQVGELD